MGLRGPAPKPTAINRVRGFPGKRAPSKLEPKPVLGRPTMPAHLDDAAKAEWEQQCPILEAMGVLTEADGIALGNLCFDRASLSKAQAELQKINLTMIVGGETEMNRLHKPLSRLVDMLTGRVNRALLQFGLTPSARTRVSAVQTKKAPDSPWAKFS